LAKMSLFIPNDGSQGLETLRKQPHFKGNSPGLAGYQAAVSSDRHRSVSPCVKKAGNHADSSIRADSVQICRRVLKRKGKGNDSFDRRASRVYCECGNS
jgi:hypothetical protein